jgi:tripartite-type tricarboxylate transporter receptor subunit TctC
MNAIKLTTFGLTGALVLGAGAGPASADAIADFYNGKRAQMLVGSSPGGGYDTYARMVTRHISRHIPGEPSWIVKNMPGAGGIVVTNFLANVAPQDGSVLALIQRNVALVQIMGQSGPRFVAKDLNWIGSLNNEAGVCAVDKRAGVKSFDDVFKKTVLMGGSGPNDLEIQPAMMNNMLGTKFQLVKGYPSTPPVHLAIERGEVHGVCQSWSSFKAISGKYYRDGNMIPIIQHGMKPHPELKKLGVPQIYKYITKEHVQAPYTLEQVRQLFDLTYAAKTMGRPVVMGPKVPKERVNAIRKAFNAMSEDPKFLADAKKQKREILLVTGEEIQKIVTDMASTPKATLDMMEESQKYKGVAKIAKIEMVKHTGKVTGTKKGGRSIIIDHKGKNVTAKVSGSRTKVMVNGKKAKRKAVKVGMTCTFTYPGAGTEAKTIDCKG